MERKIYKEEFFLYIMKKRPHNFKIEDDVWEEFQIYCIRKKTTATQVISDFIRKLINKNEKKKSNKRKIRQKK